MDDSSFVVKVRFEEGSRNLIGFFMILASAKSNVVMKCDCVVNYFTERFAKKINLIVPWASFLERIAEENEMISELMLKDFSGSIRSKYESFPSERVAKLAEIIHDVADMNLKRVMLTDFLEEDLIALFPKGEISLEFVTEVIGGEEEGEEEDDEDEEGDEDEDEEKEVPDGIETIAIDPVVDPVDGVPAIQLREGDIVCATQNRYKELNGRVISVFPASKGSDQMVVKIEIDESTWGQMVMSRSTMVGVIRDETDEPEGSSDIFFYILLGGVILIIAGFVIALAFGMM
ncbi:MAG: hypothetical protein QGH40_09145 [bacterium]|nr:hypothetical protein [bacterium]